jgi:hypothetical protein
MRKWTVEGTDNVGESRRLSVDAQDETDAQHKAYLRGITATAVYIYNPTADPLTDLEAAASHAPKHTAKKHMTKAKGSDDEVQGAAWRLRAADSILSAMGILYIIGGVLMAIVVVTQTRDALAERWPLAVGYFLGFAAAGILFLGAGAALRMLALIGISSAATAKHAARA